MDRTRGEKTMTKAGKAFGIAVNILLIVFFVICVTALILSVSAKKSADGAIRLFGYEMRLVLTSSMEKSEYTDVSDYEIKDLPVNTMIFIETVPEDEAEAREWYSSLKKGDVLTFRYAYATQETITHRIISITPNDTDGYTIELEGDNKSADEGALTQTIDTSDTDSPNYVIGKVTGSNYFLGLLVTAVKNPVGIVLIVIVPSVIIIVLEAVKIIGLMMQKKRGELLKEQQKRDEEIAELRRRLAEAEGREPGKDIPAGSGTCEDGDGSKNES